jgi:hypothetical protein
MIELPGMRRELILNIADLSDKEMQCNKWVDQRFSHSFWNNLSYSVHALFDDADYRKDDPKPIMIGITLRNKEEVAVVRHLISVLDKVLDKIGIKQPDSAYLNSPLWDDVVEAAKHAYEVLMKDEDLDALLEEEEKRVVT